MGFFVFFFVAFLGFLTLVATTEASNENSEPIKIPWNKIINYLITGDWLAKIGVVILLTSTGFLLKYMAENNLLSPPLRVAGLASLGLLLFIAGSLMKNPARFMFSVAIQGGGLGLMYMATYTSLKLYMFIEPSIAFIFFLGLSLLSGYFAFIRNAVSLAALSMVGGFIAPIFSFTDYSSPALLFSYYLILDCMVLTLAWLKGWRVLSHVSFFFVLAASLFLGFNEQYYHMKYFSVTEPFLILFFVIHFTLPLLEAANGYKTSNKFHNGIDNLMILGVPTTAFGLQYIMVSTIKNAAPISALVLGVFYISAAIITHRNTILKDFTKSFFVIGTVLITLAIPLFSKQLPIASILSLEALAIIWLGAENKNRIIVILGFVIHILAVFNCAFFGSNNYIFDILKVFLFDKAIIGITIFIAAYILHFYKIWQNPLLLVIWGTFWWVSAIIGTVDDILRVKEYIPVGLGFAFLSSLVLFTLPSDNKFVNEIKVYKFMLNITLLFWLIHVVSYKFYFNYVVLTGWLSVLGAMYGALYLISLHNKDLFSQHRAIITKTNVVTGLILIGLIEGYFKPYGGLFWTINLVGSLAIIAFVVFNTYISKNKLHISQTLLWVVTAVCLCNIFMSLEITYKHRSTAIINNIEIIQILSLTALAMFSVFCWKNENKSSILWFLTGVPLFLFIHAVPARIIFASSGSSYKGYLLFDILMNYQHQAILTLIWALTAACFMIVGKKLISRLVWFIGGAIMILVTVKLFFIDLDNTNTLTNILAMMSVGVLMLVVSYFIPLPAKTNEQIENK